MDFSALLSRPAAAVEKPPTIPAGTYLAQVKTTAFGESSQKKTPYLRVIYQVLGADTDVDPDQLEDFGGEVALLKKTVQQDFYLTEDALWRFTEYMANSLQMELGERSINELIPEMVGKTCKISVSHRPSTDGKDVFAEVKNTAPIE